MKRNSTEHAHLTHELSIKQRVLKSNNNISRFNAFYEELMASKAYNATRIKPGERHTNRPIRFSFRNRSGSDLANYTAKTMSILNKPTFFNYYLYDKKHNSSMMNKPHLTRKPQSSKDKGRETAVITSREHELTLRKSSPIQMRNEALKRMVDQSRQCHCSLSKNAEGRIEGAKGLIESQRKLRHSSVLRERHCEILNRTSREETSNELILQSVMICPIDFDQRALKPKPKKNSSYKDYALAAIEKKRLQRTQGHLLRNELIKAKTRKSASSSHISNKTFYFTSLSKQYILSSQGERKYKPGVNGH